MFSFCVFGAVLGNYYELHFVPIVFVGCFHVILQCFVMYCCNLLSVRLFVVVVAVLACFLLILFCLLQFGAEAYKSLVLRIFVVVNLLIFVLFLLGLSLVHFARIIVSVIVCDKTR